MIQSSLGIKGRLYLEKKKKQTKAKRAHRVAQVVQHLPSNHEALNSNSNTGQTNPSNNIEYHF
jgi:hypothetical protein